MATRKDGAGERPPGSFALRQWMVQLDVSDRELADRLRVDRVSIWRWRRGKRLPGKNMLPRVAQALGIKVADLFRSVDDHVSLDAAATHIRDRATRVRIAQWLKNHPAC